jgi:hypothetical protein
MASSSFGTRVEGIWKPELTFILQHARSTIKHDAGLYRNSPRIGV